MMSTWTTRWLSTIAVLALMASTFAAPVLAQDGYGSGVTVDVREVDPAAMTMDGLADEGVWDLAPTFDLLQFSNFYAVVDEPDLTVDARALWAEDTLYVFARVYDNDIFVPDAGDAWMADQLLIGIDGTHAGDDQTDPDYAGWPDNAPDLGPTTYKVWPQGITLNWGYDGHDPVASGYVNGAVYVDSTNLEWGFEAAFYVPQIEANADIGFNIGGGQAGQAGLDESGGEEATYGYFSWQATDNGSAGGDVMNDASTFATLHMQPRAGGGGSDYGIGVTVGVPEVTSDEMVMDGNDDEAAWANAPEFDLLQYANFFAMVDEPDLAATGKTLFSNDTLYVFVRVLDNEVFTPEDAGDAWMSDQILVGVDGTHAGDDQIDDSYGGWPDNAPDLGPTVYKVWPNGITLNWGFDDIDPVAEGWVNGSVFVDETTQEWGVEMAIYLPQAENGAEVGFNIGGAQASQAALDAGNEEATYGFFSWQATDHGSAGGDVMNNAGTFATLALGGTTYGSGVQVDVPRISPEALTLDGDDSENVWAEAPTFDLLQYANFYAMVDEPDLAATGKTLYANDTLYVFVRVLDNEVFAPADAGDAWMSDQILVGVDGTHAGDDQVDDSYGGWPDNAPDLGPTVYKVWPNGITSNWGYDDIDPVAEGWVRGEVFTDMNTQEWGVEMAIYLPQVEEGASIGFNIGGAQASQAALDAGNEEATYGYFSWQATDNGSSGGDVMSNAGTYATLNMSSETVAIEEHDLAEVPTAFQLEQNYPNPFNPTTTIEYGITRSGAVQLEVFNLLGQKVATLVEERRAVGTYRVTWDAEGLSSGMYLYQLRVDGDLIGTKTMTLLK